MLKNQSRLDIVFLVVFFILLLIPMSKINKDEKDYNENKTLATFKPLLNTDGTVNLSFGKNFEEYFNDRFRFKFIIFKTYNLVKYNLTNHVYQSKTAYFNKKNNWAYQVGFYKKPKYMFKKKFIDSGVKIFDEINDFCEKNNIKLYIIIAPYNYEIYDDEIFPKNTKYQIEKQKKVINAIVKQTKANVIYPVVEMKDGKKNHYVSYKVDHHWTDYGAFLTYKIIIDKIKHDFPEIKPLEEDDFNILLSKKIKMTDFKRVFYNGSSLEIHMPFLLDYKDKILDTDYIYYSHKDKKNMKTFAELDPVKRLYNHHYDKAPNLRLILIGTSFIGSLAEFFPYNFKDTKQIRLNQTKMPESEQYKILKYYGEDIKNYKPDVMIMCVTINNLLKINKSKD